MIVFLQIFDGPSVYYYPIGTFCGLRLPPPVRSSGSTVTLQFQSDSVVGGKGFLIEWTAIQDSGPLPTIPPGSTKQSIYSFHIPHMGFICKLILAKILGACNCS